MSKDSSTPRGGGCVDDLELQLIADGELSDTRLELAHLHLSACPDCAARLRIVRDGTLKIQALLGDEDEAESELAASALVRAEAGCQRAMKPAPRRRRVSVGRPFGLALAAAAAVVLVALWQAGDADLTAAPGRILDEAMVRENAWMYRPDKVLRWIVQGEISGSPRLPDGRYRTQHWLSTVRGAEGAILRKTDTSGRLVFATWRRPDGSVISYNVSRAEPLRIEPSTAEIRAALGALSREERQSLQRFLDVRAQDGEVAIQGSRFARWFLDASSSRSGVRAERMRTPDGREGYYLRMERGTESVLDRGVVRMVIETYIEGEGFKRYRQRSQRDLADGRHWIEDARWLEFSETDMRNFEANSLKDLLETMPAVKVTPRELAQRRLAAAAQ